MPTYAVPVIVKTEMIFTADSPEHAEEIVTAQLKQQFPSEYTVISVDTPTRRSAYEVTVTFYLNAFTSDEAENLVCDHIRDGIKLNNKSVSFDIENTKEGGPCRD